MYYNNRQPFGKLSRIYLASVTSIVVILWLCSLFSSNWQQYIYETKNLGYIDFNLSLWGFTINSKCNKLKYLRSSNAFMNSKSQSLEEFLCSKLNYMNGRTFGEAASLICSIDKYSFPNAQMACYNFRMLNIGSLVMIGGIIGCLVCIIFGFITFVMACRNFSISLTYAYTTLFGCSNLIAMLTLPIYYVNAGGSWIAINSLFSVVHFGYIQFTYKSPVVSDIQFFWGYSLAILAFLTSILLPLFGCYFASLTTNFHDEIKHSEKKRLYNRI